MTNLDCINLLLNKGNRDSKSRVAESGYQHNKKTDMRNGWVSVKRFLWRSLQIIASGKTAAEGLSTCGLNADAAVAPVNFPVTPLTL